MSNILDWYLVDITTLCQSLQREVDLSDTSQMSLFIPYFLLINVQEDFAGFVDLHQRTRPTTLNLQSQNHHS